jgi:hypothetical protein
MRAESAALIGKRESTFPRISCKKPSPLVFALLNLLMFKSLLTAHCRQAVNAGVLLPDER